MHQVPFRRHLISFIYLPCCPVIRGRDAFFHLNEISNSVIFPPPPAASAFLPTLSMLDGPEPHGDLHCPPASLPTRRRADRSDPSRSPPAGVARFTAAGAPRSSPGRCTDLLRLKLLSVCERTMVSVLSACAVLGALETGAFIH